MSDPTIQSPAGPPANAIGAWQVSLAEIDAMGRKAARGAGLSWGLAEEAGRAARWLAAYRLPGPEILLAALQGIAGAVTDHAPRDVAGPWSAPSGRLCPIHTGAALSDRAERIAAGAHYDLAPVLSPLLLVPFIARAARDLDCLIAMRGDGIEVVATAAGPTASDWQAQAFGGCPALTIARAERAPPAIRLPGPEPWRVPVDVWRALDQFAQRTYVPASEASRQSGAGAGIIDRD